MSSQKNLKIEIPTHCHECGGAGVRTRENTVVCSDCGLILDQQSRFFELEQKPTNLADHYAPDEILKSTNMRTNTVEDLSKVCGRKTVLYQNYNISREDARLKQCIDFLQTQTEISQRFHFYVEEMRKFLKPFEVCKNIRVAPMIAVFCKINNIPINIEVKQYLLEKYEKIYKGIPIPKRTPQKKYKKRVSILPDIIKSISNIDQRVEEFNQKYGVCFTKEEFCALYCKYKDLTPGERMRRTKNKKMLPPDYELPSI